jgi:hypothetical protein
MNYRPKNSFSMSYASRKVIFPGVGVCNEVHLAAWERAMKYLWQLGVKFAKQRDV